jgi:hypothetical protein
MMKKGRTDPSLGITSNEHAGIPIAGGFPLITISV